MEMLGGQVGRVAGQERDRVLDLGVVNATPQLRQEPADGEADDDPAGPDVEKPQARRGKRERPRHRGRDRHAIRYDCGRIVDHALALEDDHQAPRQRETAQERRRGRHVRGRDDGAQRERRRPRQPRNHAVRHPSDHDRQEQNVPDAE